MTGAGPIELMVMEAACAAGVIDIVITGIVEEKLQRAAKRGANHTVNARTNL